MATQERGVRTRGLILRAAGAVFAERGFDGATINEVISRTGLTRGAFYFHFHDKEALANAVLAEQADAATVLPQHLKLQELVDAGLVFAHRVSVDLMLQGSIRLSVESGPGLGVERDKPFRTWIDHNLGLLRQAQDNGEVFPHVDAAEVAELLVGAFSGVQGLSEVLAGRRDLERRTVVLLSYLLPGIAVPSVLSRLDLSEGRGARIWQETCMAAEADPPTVQ
ncbi:ScbR family autoregulator-binding transcription factor [Streptomyces alanosinicus]|uniref:Gamma-butyrolactone-binding protein n=1 Tax=Streptomyces alanosinicus TaxID=68171 RepID=A0A918YTQ4_9ACTN|nr:ScbR family autoregulator-binding transcription factor [Streptomyces alanosinicus]GHE15601.1 gamma-butyrolactone-binding protein [Streptomyces alanosinicus]